ncbi:type II toxin-antitoxin system RelE/ParE family toxin [Marinitenerispora sediminis]|uniref:Type II toxin-antitoxin system RelE/ParE family toxin n=2 Tax=Marinitenerispora sediminis TaxID=1931232 RepID=A0A368T249_9ACTN|nr:type II toxin-antitoxin system RelE/ParE family toxin [Marinitenerispora sediminis]RCV51485.1 type II toxin-antitoxin system RelE/ParE family toxin [Marinitenerispora sediminis]RCV55228.1 type II toxin-antitoxin system RelE/ParE family toxin [Marinitenerispora sediminis]
MAKLDKPVRTRVLAKIRGLADHPRPPGCVQLKGHPGLWRVEVGDHRIVYPVRDGQLLVLVLNAAHRSVSYRTSSCTSS